VNPEYKREDDRLTADIESAKGVTRTAIQALDANWASQAKLRKSTTTRDSLRQRAEALEKTLPTLSGDDQAIVDRYDKVNEFESKRIHASKHADQILQEIASTAAELLNQRDLSSALSEDVAPIQQRYRDLYKAFGKGITQLQSEVKGKRAELAAAEAEWGPKFKDARKARDDVLEKLGAHKTVTSQIIKLREEITDITNQIGDLDAKLKAGSDPATALKQALAQLKQATDQRADRTQEWAKEIERLSSGKIKAVVIAAGDVSEVKDAVDVVASKTGSQEGTRLKAIDDALASDKSGMYSTGCAPIVFPYFIGGRWEPLRARSSRKSPT